jgi:glycosyltransferase involved in cell wall biosynthesis
MQLFGLSAVISTSRGQGLCVRNGFEIFIEDDLAEFALCVVALLKSKDFSALIGESAGTLVKSNYYWKQITAKLRKRPTCLLKAYSKTCGCIF